MVLTPCAFILTNTPAALFQRGFCYHIASFKKKISPPFGKVKAKCETCENEQSRKETTVWQTHMAAQSTCGLKLLGTKPSMSLGHCVQA